MKRIVFRCVSDADPWRCEKFKVVERWTGHRGKPRLNHKDFLIASSVFFIVWCHRHRWKNVFFLFTSSVSVALIAHILRRTAIVKRHTGPRICTHGAHAPSACLHANGRVGMCLAKLIGLTAFCSRKRQSHSLKSALQVRMRQCVQCAPVCASVRQCVQCAVCTSMYFDNSCIHFDLLLSSSQESVAVFCFLLLDVSLVLFLHPMDLFSRIRIPWIPPDFEYPFGFEVFLSAGWRRLMGFSSLTERMDVHQWSRPIFICAFLSFFYMQSTMLR